MATFLLLYTGGGPPATEDEQAAVIQAWTDWFDKLGETLIDAGNPFTPTAKIITSDGYVSDGPLGTMATGYSILKADSLEAATAMAKGCPHLQSGGQITVYETFNVM